MRPKRLRDKEVIDSRSVLESRAVFTNVLRSTWPYPRSDRRHHPSGGRVLLQALSKLPNVMHLPVRSWVMLLSYFKMFRAMTADPAITAG